jgi:hypothetical protein
MGGSLELEGCRPGEGDGTRDGILEVDEAGDLNEGRELFMGFPGRSDVFAV